MGPGLEYRLRAALVSTAQHTSRPSFRAIATDGVPRPICPCDDQDAALIQRVTMCPRSVKLLCCAKVRRTRICALYTDLVGCSQARPRDHPCNDEQGIPVTPIGLFPHPLCTVPYTGTMHPCTDMLCPCTLLWTLYPLQGYRYHM